MINLCSEVLHFRPSNNRCTSMCLYSPAAIEHGQLSSLRFANLQNILSVRSILLAYLTNNLFSLMNRCCKNWIEKRSLTNKETRWKEDGSGAL